MATERTFKRARTSLFGQDTVEIDVEANWTPEKCTKLSVRQRQAQRSLFADDTQSNSVQLLRHTKPKQNEIRKRNGILREAPWTIQREAVLIGDGSRKHVLPTVPGKLSDIQYVTPEVVSEVVEGKYSGLVQHTIIDCRYPYEYNGGHIKGATNLYTDEGFQKYLHQRREDCREKCANSILILHCEFSCERGPKLCRFLRNEDRKLNKENYPALLYPEIYIMSGGYKSFFASYKTFCCPDDYVLMLHPEHAEEFGYFRSKSVSGSMLERKRRAQHSLRF